MRFLSGRTDTAPGCLAVLDGVSADEALAYVRRGYDPHAIEDTVAETIRRPVQRPAAPRAGRQPFGAADVTSRSGEAPADAHHAALFDHQGKP